MQIPIYSEPVFNAYGVFGATGQQTKLVSYEQLSSGDIKVNITYDILSKMYVNSIGDEIWSKDKSGGIQVELSFILSKASKIDNNGNGTLNVSISKSDPINHIAISATYANTDQRQRAEWIISKMMRHGIGFMRSDSSLVKDKFTFK